MPDLTGLTWFKSSYSFANGDCVEVADPGDGHVLVRDSKHPGKEILRFSRLEWVAFIAGAKAGEFDNPEG